MNYQKRLDRAFINAPILPITPYTHYVFFSDCHRGVGNNNDNFLKNSNSFYAALQYYYQYGFTYIEVGDGDELWENRDLCPIIDAHHDIFSLLCRFQNAGRLYMLYGNHDMDKKDMAPILNNIRFYESIILQSENPDITLYVTHGHQADAFNSTFWKLAKFLVRYVWAPLEQFGVLEPTSAANSTSKKEKLEQKYITYAKNRNSHLLVGHNHKPFVGNINTPYHNCGSLVHPKYITCVELCGYNINLVKWCSTTEKSYHFGNIYSQCPPTFPVYVKRELLAGETLT